MNTKSHLRGSLFFFFFFKPERVKIFRCKSKSRPFLPFFLLLFFFLSLSWHRGTYFIEISPQFVRFVSTVIQAQGDGERMVNDICTRVHMRGQHFCALNKNDSQYLGQWLIFLRRFWDGGVRERGARGREKEGGGGGGGEGGEGTKVSHFSWHPRVFVLSIEPLCSTLRYPKSHVSIH